MEDLIKKLKESREETRLLLLSQELERKSDFLEKRENELNVKESLLSDIELKRSYRVEFNSQSYASFYNTKIEKDKSILTLSIAALGFIITLIDTPLALNWKTATLLTATVALLFSAHTIITIFDKNADYIVAITQDIGDYSIIESHLKKLDKRATKSFYLGLSLCLALGISPKPMEPSEMSEKQSQNSAQSELLKKSFDGASSMKPVTTQENPKQPPQEKKND